MLYILIILGMFFGAITAGFSGFLLGGVTGYLLWQVSEFKRRIADLENALKIAQPPQAHASVIVPKPQTTQNATPEQSPQAAAEEKVTPVSQPLPVTDPVTAQASLKTIQPAATAKAKPAAAARTGEWEITGQSPVEEPPFVRWIKNYFTTGNTLVRVGVVILFIGVAFLVKYAAEQGIVPIELRMAAVALGGLVLVVIGWRVRAKNVAFSLAAQGGGVAIFYLTIFAAMRLYNLVPPEFAFGLLLLVCVMSSALAVMQNSLALAVLGFSGGFLAPVITSTGGGSHVMLFSYYALLNAGVLGIAWYKAWRALNLVGFIFTFIIGSAWGVMRYDAGLFLSTEPFLILFFVFYVAISVLYALRQPINLRGYVDGTLVFGTPIVVFGLQYGLVNHLQFGLAYSAIALCIFYVMLAYSIFKFVAKYNTEDGIKLICESFLSIGVVFGTVAIPLALDDQWTSAAWCLEGAALIYIAVRQKRNLAYFAGIALQLGAAWFVLHQLDDVQHLNHWVILNGSYVSALLVCIAGCLSGLLVYRHKDSIKYYVRHTENIMLAWGFAWWLIGGFYEVFWHGSRHASFTWFLIFGAITALTAHVCGSLLHWRSMRLLHRSLVVFMLAALIGSAAELQHPFTKWIGLGWLVVFITYYMLLKMNDSETLSPFARWQHGIGVWLITLLLSWEAAWQVDAIMPHGTVWGLSLWILLPGVLLTIIIKSSEKIPWPFGRHRELYTAFSGAPIIIYLYLAIVVIAFTNEGNTAPILYLPLINPLDITSGFGFVCVLFWLQSIKSFSIQAEISKYSKQIVAAVAVLAFIMINMALLRTIHHYTAMPFNYDGFVRSDLAQTSLTLLWSVMSVTAMVMASKKQWRAVWITGAGLIAIVVLKLFMMDLANIGTVERIVSFIGVGVLMLAVGYFAPLPPRQQTRVATESVT